MSESTNPLQNMPIFNSIQTFSKVPFEGDTSNDIVIQILEFNEEGLEIAVIKDNKEASPNEYGLTQWLVSRLGFLKYPVKTGDVFYVRTTLLTPEKVDAITH